MSNDGEIKLHLEVLGATLRRLRTDRGHSLVDVANGTGLSTSFLSLVENGRSDISTGRLYRVAHFLGVGLADLLDMEPPRGPHIVRASERRPVAFPGDSVSVFPLSDDRGSLAMGPTYTVMELGGGAPDLPLIEGTEHFAIVISGSLEMELASGKTFTLDAGDSVYLTSEDQPRHSRNVGEGPLELVWVFSPPVLTGAAGPGEQGRPPR